MYKIIFCDLDGTLLKDDKTLPEENAKAISSGSVLSSFKSVPVLVTKNNFIHNFLQCFSVKHFYIFFFIKPTILYNSSGE